MQRNKVHHVHTVGRVAKDLGVDEDLIHELTLGLEPEDGVIWVSTASTTETGPWPLPTKAWRRSNSCWRSTTGSGHQSPDTCAAVLTGWIPQQRGNHT
jgi:hypothetical protein